MCAYSITWLWRLQVPTETWEGKWCSSDECRQAQDSKRLKKSVSGQAQRQERTEVPAQDGQAEGIPSYSLIQSFCTIVVFNWLDEAHPIREGYCFFQCTDSNFNLIQNTPTDTCRITFEQIPGHLAIQSNWHIKLTITYVRKDVIFKG